MSKIDTLNELLGNYCAGGYSSGFIGEANARWVEDNFGDIAKVYHIYRLGYAACLLASVEEDTPGVDELIEILQGLDDYPLIDDEYLNRLTMEDECRVVRELSADWDIPEVDIWKAVNELDGYFEWEQDYSYYAGDLEELRAEASKVGQTWSAHYNSEMPHTPEVCEYCKEAEEVA